jgi:hypothetical protein
VCKPVAHEADDAAVAAAQDPPASRCRLSPSSGLRRWLQQTLLCTPHHNQEVEGAFSALDNCRQGNESDERLQARQLSIYNHIRPLREENQRAAARSKVIGEDGTFQGWQPSSMSLFYERRLEQPGYTAQEWEEADKRVREQQQHKQQSVHEEQLVKAHAPGKKKKGKKRSMLTEASAAEEAATLKLAKPKKKRKKKD